MDLAQLREDIGDLLTPLGVLRVYPTIPDSLVGKCAVIYPETIDYDDSYDETATAVLIVQLVAPTAASKATQNELDALLSTGTGSVHDAFLTDGRFRVATMRNYGTLQLADGGSRYYSAELVIDVLT